MGRTLFFHMKHRKYMEDTNNKPFFRQYNIFHKYKYFFFQSVFWSIFSRCQKSQSNQEQCSLCRTVARLVFVFCCALTTSRCNAFQHIFINQKKFEFYGPYFQTMLFLVTVVYIIKNSNILDVTKCPLMLFSPYINFLQKQKQSC